MAAKNNITRSVSPKSLFEDAKTVISSAVSFNQGDLLYLDTSAHLIKKLSAETDALTFVGVAVVSISSGKLLSPYNTDVVASQAIQHIPGPKFGVICSLTLKTSDSLNPGDLVYADPSTGTDGVSASGTKAIGVYQGAAVSSAAAGTKVEVLLGARYPSDTLRF